MNPIAAISRGPNFMEDSKVLEAVIVWKILSHEYHPISSVFLGSES
jgi:hypothetical protein